MNKDRMTRQEKDSRARRNDPENFAPPDAIRRQRLIGDLSAFFYAARAGSLQGGARELGLNRNSLSRYLDELEEASGVRLRATDPETRGLVLTEAGRHLASLLEPLFSRLETVSAQLMGGLQELRLGCQSSTSCYLLPGWIQAFGAERLKSGDNATEPPRFSLKTGSSEAILESLRGLEVDLGIIAADFERERTEGGVTYLPLFREALLAICHRDHPLASAGPVPVEKFARHSQYLYYLGGERYQERINALASGEGASRLMEFDTMAAIKETVRAGLGISIVPAGAVREEDRSWLRVVPLQVPPNLAPRMVRAIALTAREADELTPLAREFADFLKSHRKELAGL
jgi:DNA-binding transcriptional LysR family regulator